MANTSSSSITTEPKAILKIKEDVSKVVEQFLQCNDIRYESFAAIWSQLNMSHIYAGRGIFQSGVEFVEDCYSVSLSYISPQKSFQEQVIGLYLMYAFYCTQPVAYPVKIRMIVTQWIALINLVERLRDEKHNDAEFIFHSLRIKNAFWFTAVLNEFIMDRFDRRLCRSKVQNCTDPGTFFEIDDMGEDILSTTFNAENIEPFSWIHQRYQEIKERLFEKEKGQQMTNQVKNDLVQHITKTIAHYEEIKTGKRLLRPRRHDGDVSGSEIDSGSEFSEAALSEEDAPMRPAASKKKKSAKPRRAAIRKKAFQQDNTGKERVGQRTRQRQISNQSIAFSANNEEPGLEASDHFLKTFENLDELHTIEHAESTMDEISS